MSEQPPTREPVTERKNLVYSARLFALIGASMAAWVGGIWLGLRWMPESWALAAPAGGVIGFVLGSAVGLALLRRPLAPAIAAIVLPCLLAGYAADEHVNLLWTLLAVGVAYSGGVVFLCLAAPEVWSPWSGGFCEGCTYPLDGLAGGVCPECGRAFGCVSGGRWLTPRRGRRRAFALACAALVVPPVGSLVLDEPIPPLRRGVHPNDVPLAVRLGSVDYRMRAHGQAELRRSGDAELVERLLAHPNPYVRIATVEAMRTMDFNRWVGRVKRVMEEDADAGVRAAAERVFLEMMDETFRRPSR